MSLRIIGDVHAQVGPDDLVSPGKQPYLDLIAGVAASVQVGDMGDSETYAALIAHADPVRHRFVPGNHDHYDCLPPHAFGDFGTATLGGVAFFFIRGAASSDRAKLTRLGRELGRKLWFEEEELTDERMRDAEAAYLAARPAVVISHDGPTDIARFAAENARRGRPPAPGSAFRTSRTNEFLARLLARHAPKLWYFGHHHRDWTYTEGGTRFVCVGELSFLDIDAPA